MSAASPSESNQSISHTSEKVYRCKACRAEYTSHDRLLRHKQTCGALVSSKRSRRKSCLACAESKIKCNLVQPCSKCVTRGKDCVFVNDPRVTRSPGMENQKRRRIEDMSKRDKVPPSASTKDTAKRNTDAALRTQTTAHRQQKRVAESAISFKASAAVSPQSADSPPDTFFDTMTLPVNLPSSSSIAWDALSSNLPNNTALVDLMTNSVFDTTQGRAQLTTWGNPDHMLDALDLNFRDMDQAFGSSSSAITENVHMSTPQPTAALQGILESPSDTDLQKYMHSFCTSFLNHVPMINPYVWNTRSQCPIVLNVVYACGALFYQGEDPKAARLVEKALTEYRGVLASQFGQSIADSDDSTTHSLIIAMTLLQHLGLHSSELKHRELASLYHGMTIAMIRRSGVMSKIASFTPPSLSDPDRLESTWREWANMEILRRCIFGVFVQDCCQCIYFSLSPCIENDELAFALPCDDEIWRASSAHEWASILSKPSVYGTGAARLKVGNFQYALTNMTMLQASQMQAQDGLLNPGAYIILIHALLRNLYAASSGPDKTAGINALFASQFALHNWLRQWLDNEECVAIERCSRSNASPDEQDQVPFWCNVLPFYWLAQVTLFAIQQGIPITGAKFFNLSEGIRTTGVNGGGNEREGSMLKEMKEWMEKVRTHLRAGSVIPIELMQVQPSSLRK